MPKIYKALRSFNTILKRKENEVCVALEPGTAVIMNNWRVLHGRKGFEGSRRMCGAYISMDDFKSRLETLVFKDRLD